MEVSAPKHDSLPFSQSLGDPLSFFQMGSPGTLANSSAFISISVVLRSTEHMPRSLNFFLFSAQTERKEKKRNGAFRRYANDSLKSLETLPLHRVIVKCRERSVTSCFMQVNPGSQTVSMHLRTDTPQLLRPPIIKRL